VTKHEIIMGAVAVFGIAIVLPALLIGMMSR
jgi:hypothetical protein